MMRHVCSRLHCLEVLAFDSRQQETGSIHCLRPILLCRYQYTQQLAYSAQHSQSSLIMLSAASSQRDNMSMCKFKKSFP